ncbi:HAD hydrolase-like protein (plasmid) [Rhizobium sullae]|uniref:HAD hydrolase-like protein n=1 Tax=Rhizobium sullae TaxID=50338 RepID=A0ABY5Y076_RHISU|nr:HAD family hydrolase [Rhizobium sullae]UWU19478.1 HAD hydrolase-like protein [Rhizobium sullae]
MQIRASLIDLDGTLINGQGLLPGAKELLARFDHFALVSNDSEHTPVHLANRLCGLGLSISPEHILLAGAAALESIAKERPDARVMLVGSTMLSQYGQDLGLHFVGHDPEIVLLARDRNFTYAKLAAASNAVRSGAELIVANPDVTHPGQDGDVVPETGALLAAVLACAGDVPYRVIGKPEPYLFERALNRLGIRPADAVMIGDNLLTDGVGAERLGIEYIDVNSAACANLLKAA